MGKPSPNAMKSFRERQERTAGWWHEVIQLAPKFAADAIRDVADSSRKQLLGGSGISDEHRDYLMKLRDAVANGPEALYLLVRTKPNGKLDNQQNIFRALRFHFDLTYRECREIADRVEASNSE